MHSSAMPSISQHPSGLKIPRGDGCLYKSKKQIPYQLLYSCCLFTAKEQVHMAVAEGKLLALEKQNEH